MWLNVVTFMGVLNACVNVGAFWVGMHLELKLKLEVNVLEVLIFISQKIKFCCWRLCNVATIMAMEFSFCNSTTYVTKQQAILPKLSRIRQQCNLEKTYKFDKEGIQHWIRIKWLYNLNKAQCKVGIRCIKNAKAITCVGEIEGWCFSSFYLYYPSTF
jgi:hypothetical protein